MTVYAIINEVKKRKKNGEVYINEEVVARTVRTVRKSKEEVHYPRHVKELCQIMEEAKERGQLRAVMEEEFKKPVSMTGIWECRSYFHMEDENGYEGDTVLLSIRALLATMEGKLKRGTLLCGYVV